MILVFNYNNPDSMSETASKMCKKGKHCMKKIFHVISASNRIVKLVGQIKLSSLIETMLLVIQL